MPSFDVSSDVNWHEVENAVQQATKEVAQRFDFKGVKSEIKLDLKAKTITFWVSEEGKLDALNDILQSKLVKRGVSLLSLDYQTVEEAFASSARQVVNVQAGVSKEKAKDIISALKESRLKVQSQIQDEKVRVSGKSRDDLQAAMAVLREKQDTLKVPMQFGNFRD